MKKKYYTFLISANLFQGSKDNMSIVLVTFPAAPKPSPEAQKADLELDETLRQRLTGCYYSLLHACLPKSRNTQTEVAYATDNQTITMSNDIEIYNGGIA